MLSYTFCTLAVKNELAFQMQIIVRHTHAWSFMKHVFCSYQDINLVLCVVVLYLVCHRPVSRVPNAASASGLSILDCTRFSLTFIDSYQIQDFKYYALFGCFVFLQLVYTMLPVFLDCPSWLPLRYSLTFIYCIR